MDESRGRTLCIGDPKSGFPWVPFVAGLGTAVIAALLSWALAYEADANVRQNVYEFARATAGHVEAHLQEQRGAILRLAERTALRPELLGDAERADLRQYQASFPEIASIGLVVAGRVLWCEPESTAPSLPAVPRPHAADGASFLAVGHTADGAPRYAWAAVVPSAPESVLVCTLDGATLLRRMLPVEDVERVPGRVRVLDGGAVLFSSGEAADLAPDFVSRARVVHQGDWAVDVVPTRAYVMSQSTLLARAVLVSGLLVAALLAFALQAARRLRAASAASERTADELRVLSTEEARTRALYEGVFDASPDAVVVVDGSGRILRINAEAEATFGWALAEAVGREIELLVPAAVRPVHERLRNGYLRAPHNRRLGEGRRLIASRRDGSDFPMEASLAPVETDQGTVVVAVVRDVTEAVRAEAAVEASELRYRRFFEETPSGACVTKADGTIVACNPAFARMFGLPGAAAAVGTSAAPLYRDPVARLQLIEDVRRDGAVLARPVELQSLDGAIRHTLLTVSAVRDEHGEIATLLSHVVDVTAARLLEDKLRQSQKLEALGRLAGGVAHDFNNLLTAITGYSEMVLKTLDAGDQRHAWCREVLSTAERAGNLTRQLLAFSRKQPVESMVLDLGEVVTSLEKMLTRIVGEDVTIRVTLGEDLHRIRADRTHLEQVLLNLSVNARDAMPHGGRLGFSVRNVERPDPPGSWVELAVADTGGGMTKDVAERVFEPFFTTKDHGTGLGLSTVYGIVEQCGGQIGVESAPGRGTTFRVVFPAVPADVACSTTGDSAGPPSGNGTVLVVEDDPQVREFTLRALEAFGYTAIPADSPRDALRILATKKRIDLLLTDVVIPQMSGRELATAAHDLRPPLRVLFMSGHPQDSMLRAKLLDESALFLPKPFTPTTLARRVAEAMRASPTTSSKA